MAKTSKQLALAGEHLRAGNLDRARRLFRRVLSAEPDNADAWHLLGAAAAQAGDFENALAAIAKAIQIRGPEPEMCANLGHVLVRLGRHGEAAACFRQALAADPLNGRLSFNLGYSLLGSGSAKMAISAFEHATDIDPRDPANWYALGFARYSCGDRDGAAACYERVLRLDPDHVETLFNLGVIRMDQMRFPEARTCFDRALAIDPDHAEALNNLGLLQHNDGENQAAASSFRRACRVRDPYYAAEFNLARLLAIEQDMEGALTAYERSVARRPEHVDARLGLASVLTAVGRTPEAVGHLEAALALARESVAAKLNLAIALLELGRWREAWGLYESRIDRHPDARRGLGRPAWAGEPIAGRRILIHSEQGLGDTIQFCRYAPLVRELGATVVLECQPSLARIMETVDGLESVVASGTQLPAFDCHSPLLSLPGVFGTEPSTVPSDVPYLLADSDLAEKWRVRLLDALDPGLFRVGLTWAGNPGHANDRNRSMDPALLEPLAHIPGIALFDLQKNAQEQAPFVEPLAEHCADFADTAAAILNLDLVISVDTSVAHLAGAMGKPVWVLLPFAADWRWLRDRNDTPWYPTMRLFRQPKRGDWSSVIEEVRQELQNLLGT